MSPETSLIICVVRLMHFPLGIQHLTFIIDTQNLTLNCYVQVHNFQVNNNESALSNMQDSRLS